MWLVRKRQVVGLLELAENFRLADDHRVEARGDFEQMVQAVRFGQGVKFVAQRAVIGVMRDEKFPHFGKGMSAASGVAA